MAKSGNRTTFQFAIPQALQDRLNVVRRDLPGIGSPAPLLRQSLEQWVESWETALAVKENGGNMEELGQALTDVLAKNLARAIAASTGVVVKTDEKGGSTG